jgi:hypothetical protein
VLRRLPPVVLALALGLPVVPAGAQQAAIVFPDFINPGHDALAEVTYFTNCLRQHEVEVVPEKSLVRVTAVEGCTCPASPAIETRFTANLGRLPARVHRVELYVAHREDVSPLPCGLPRLLASANGAVSRSGFVRGLDVQPAAPRPGDAVAVRIQTFCGVAWAPPEVTGPPRERVIRIAPGNGPLPPAFRLTPCPGNGTDQTLPLGNLPAGVYRVELLRADGQVDTSTRFVVAPEPGEPLLLGLPGQEDRFRVRATWRDAQGLAGVARPGTLTPQTGFFWFFDPANVEALVKVIDGCTLNGRLWVFLAGLTDVETHVAVEDTETGEVRTYTNLLRTPFAPVQDVGALVGCPGG